MTSGHLQRQLRYREEAYRKWLDGPTRTPMQLFNFYLKEGMSKAEARRRVRIKFPEFV
jgi:hypothetical protein